jgi:hypothetical protein
MQAVRLPQHHPSSSAQASGAPHSYNINFHLNTAIPHDSRRLDLFYPTAAALANDDSNYVAAAQANNNNYSSSVPVWSAAIPQQRHYSTSQSVRKSSIMRQIQRDRQHRETSSATRQSIDNFRKKIFFKHQTNANATMVNGPTP